MIAMFLTFAGLIAGDVQPARIDAGELKRFQGTWEMIGLESDTKKFAADELPVLTLVVKDESWTIKLRNGGEARAKIVLLDPKAKPARLSLEIGGSTYHAIYRFEKDVLLTNNGDAGVAAPTDFRPTKSASGGASQYKRKTKE